MGSGPSMEKIEADFFFSLASLLQTEPDEFGNEDFSIYVGFNPIKEPIKKLAIKPFYTKTMEELGVDIGKMKIMEIPKDIGEICYDFMALLKTEFVTLHVGKPTIKNDRVHRRISLVATRQDYKTEMYFAESIHKENLYLKDKEDMKTCLLKSIGLVKKLLEEEEEEEEDGAFVITEEQLEEVRNRFLKKEPCTHDECMLYRKQMEEKEEEEKK